MSNDHTEIITPSLVILGPDEKTEKRGGETWAQISVARSFPRDMNLFKRKVEADVLRNPEQAAKCTYELNRNSQNDPKKKIEGPTIRFAEALARGYGNVRISAEIVEDTGTHIVARARFWDLESNLAFSEDVHRRITTKNGQRYGDDMIGVTANAAMSIAFRNVVLAGVPESEWRPLHDATQALAKKALSHDFETKRQKVVSWFFRQGAYPDDLKKFFNGTDPMHATIDDIERLSKVGQGIVDGLQTIASAFGHDEDSQVEPTKSQSKAQTTKQQTQRPAANGKDAATQSKSETESQDGEAQQAGSKWTKAELASRFSKAVTDDVTNMVLHEQAIVLLIEASGLGDITDIEFRELGSQFCALVEDDIAGTMLCQLQQAMTKESCGTAAQSVHAGKSQRKISEDMHRALSGYIARRMRELKAK